MLDFCVAIYEGPQLQVSPLSDLWVYNKGFTRGKSNLKYALNRWTQWESSWCQLCRHWRQSWHRGDSVSNDNSLFPGHDGGRINDDIFKIMNHLGPFQYKYGLYRNRDYKMRWVRGRLIWRVKIHILVRRHLYIESDPGMSRACPLNIDVCDLMNDNQPCMVYRWWFTYCRIGAKPLARPMITKITYKEVSWRVRREKLKYIQGPNSQKVYKLIIQIIYT